MSASHPAALPLRTLGKSFYMTSRPFPRATISALSTSTDLGAERKDDILDFAIGAVANYTLRKSGLHRQRVSEGPTTGLNRSSL
jgi:hypothetical protein